MIPCTNHRRRSKQISLPLVATEHGTSGRRNSCPRRRYISLPEVLGRGGRSMAHTAGRTLASKAEWNAIAQKYRTKGVNGVTAYPYRREPPGLLGSRKPDLWMGRADRCSRTCARRGVRLMPVKLCIWAGSAHKVSTYSVCIWARGNVTEYKRETRPARSKAHLRNGCFLFILIVLLVSVLNLPLGRFIHWEHISIELVEDHGVLSCSRPDSPFVLLGKSIQVTLPRA